MTTRKVLLPGVFCHDELMFGVPKLDKRLKNKDEVLGLIFGQHPGRPLAISADYLAKNSIYHDRIGDISFVVFTDRSSAIRVYESKGLIFRGWDRDRTAVDEMGYLLDSDREPARGWRRSNPLSAACSPCLLVRLVRRLLSYAVGLLRRLTIGTIWDGKILIRPPSSALGSARYAAGLGNGGVYTPQLVVDGATSFVGSDKAKALSVIASAATSPKAELEIRAIVKAGEEAAKTIELQIEASEAF